MIKGTTHKIVLIGTFLCLVMLSGIAYGQTPVFSQFHMMPTLLNPSMIGQVNGPRFGLIYRNQWPAIGNAYETYGFAYDQFLEEANSSIGVNMLSDHAGNGILKSQRLVGQYAYRITTPSGWRSQLGIEVGMGQEAVDYSGLVFLDQLDPRFGKTTPGGNSLPTQEPPFETYSKLYLDIGAGASLYNEKYFFTIGVGHLNRPSVSFREMQNGRMNGMPLFINAMAGAKYVLKKGTSYNPNEKYISPTILYAQQGGTGQLNAGVHYGTGIFGIGTFYRHAFTNPDAIGITASVKVGNIRFGYAYDLTVSRLGISTGGSHEIGMTLAIEKRKAKYDDCYNMFR